MAWGRRCDLGCASWPDSDEYTTCPECQEDTTRFSNLTPLDPDEARSRKNHIEFERYYEEREQRRRAEVEALLPSPDQV